MSELLDMNCGNIILVEDHIFRGGNHLRLDHAKKRPMIIMASTEEKICAIPLTSKCYTNQYQQYHCKVEGLEWNQEYLYLKKSQDFACLREVTILKHRYYEVAGEMNLLNYLNLLNTLLSYSQQCQETKTKLNPYYTNFEEQIYLLEATRTQTNQVDLENGCPIVVPETIEDFDELLEYYDMEDDFGYSYML